MVVLGTAALVPWLWWKLKKYQHDHYAYGAEQTALHAGKGMFYTVFSKTSGVMLLCVLGVIAVVLLLVLLGGMPSTTASTQRSGARLFAGATALLFVVVPVAIVLLQLVPRAFFTSRLQNLLWSNTSSASLRFRSALRFGPLLRLTLKNWLLTILTLGLYWPFAAVAMARLRLEAMLLELHVDPAQLSNRTRADPGEAAGDAAGDVFGVDIGL